MGWALVLGLLVCGCATTPPKAPVAGHFTWGHEVRVFRPCSSSLVYWVAGPDTAMALLRMRHQALATQPYDSVYVRLSGKVGDVPPELADGFPGAYDGLYRLTSVHEVRLAEDSDCRH